MPEFIADARDIQFALFEQAGFDRLFSLPLYKELDRPTAEAILDEAYKFAKNTLAPLNAIGDQEGVTYDPQTKSVKMPKAFHEAYQLYCENGWLSLPNSPEWGGQGMPYSLHLAVNDFFFGACLSFCLNALLSTGAGHLVEVFGTDELKKLFLEKMYSGQWGGTMCLTEAGAGTDVGSLRTRAKKEGDHYLIEGEKVFITSGDHDLTENICHPVLARIEGAPAGTKGISLFLVPKVRVNPDGSLGEPNDVVCTGTEHKMGIHASPTCTLVFGDEGKCHGYLLGEEHKGMRAMFQMMNEARISVGLQGTALANAAYQLALAYAHERVQGKDLFTGKDAHIIDHPDVRRMLMWQKAIAEGTRALLIRTAMFYDRAESSDDEAEREKYHGMIEVLTPICKAFPTDQGFRSVELSLQTMGGYGYLTEYGIEQLLRDTKIASIYEGTNGIQALDLVGRKLPAKGGENLRNLIGYLNEMVEQNTDHEMLKDDVQILANAIQGLVDVSMHFAMIGMQQPKIPVTHASPYLDLFGHVVVGWLLMEQAIIAYPRLAEIGKAKGIKLDDGDAVTQLCADNDDARFYYGKIKVAQFYARQALATCPNKAEVIKQGDLSALEAAL